MLKATEIMFLVGLSGFFTGIWMIFGLGWSLTTTGAVLLIAAFRNAAEREKGTN